MPRRRARRSRSSASSSRRRFSWKNRCRVCQSPSTSALRMNSSRAPAGSIAPVGHRPRRDDRQPVQGDLLDGHGRAAPGVPVRLAVGAPDQVPGQRLGPLRLDPRDRPAPTAGRSPPARRPSPRPAAAGPARSRGRWRTWRRGRRRTPPARAAGRGPSAGRGRCSVHLDGLHADVRQQAGQQRHGAPRSARPAGIPGLACRDVQPGRAVGRTRRPGRASHDLEAQVAWRPGGAARSTSCHSRTRR